MSSEEEAPHHHAQPGASDSLRLPDCSKADTAWSEEAGNSVCVGLPLTPYLHPSFQKVQACSTPPTKLPVTLMQGKIWVMITFSRQSAERFSQNSAGSEREAAGGET